MHRARERVRCLVQEGADGAWAEKQDEVLAGYLQCSGMLAADNHCLERLACQFSADALRAPLHKDVASLVIYTLLRNRFIPERFKRRLRDAAQQARPARKEQHGDATQHCLRRFPCEQRRRSPFAHVAAPEAIPPQHQENKIAHRTTAHH
ncbi:uncharacterized protein LOC144167703 [Haemaphysalis longicornis]